MIRMVQKIWGVIVAILFGLYLLACLRTLWLSSDLGDKFGVAWAMINLPMGGAIAGVLQAAFGHYIDDRWLYPVAFLANLPFWYLLGRTAGYSPKTHLKKAYQYCCCQIGRFLRSRG